MTGDEQGGQTVTSVRPLAYVVIELRIPFTPRLAKQSIVDDLSSRLPELGVVRAEKRQRAVPDGDSLQIEVDEGWRFSDLGMTRSLIVSGSTVVYETTHYPGFESFLTDFAECLKAVVKAANPVGYDRLGLRYVNEVWPPTPVESFADWTNWVAPELITTLAGSEAAMALGDVPDVKPRLTLGEAALRYSLPDNCGLALNLAMRHGAGVVGDAPLKRRDKPPTPGMFFVIDFDGYWPRQQSEVRGLEEAEILTLLRTVHSPVKAGFRWATTPDFITEVGIEDVYN